MIQDALLLFSSAQALTSGTVDSTNIVDLSVARDMGLGEAPELYLQVNVATALTGGTSINFQFQGSADNSTYAVFAESGAVLTASLTAGAQVLRIPVPAQPANALVPRYYKMTYVISGTYGAGTVNAFITPDRQAALAYTAGVTQFL